MDCRFEPKENQSRVRVVGWCYEHKATCGVPIAPIKLRAKNGAIIDFANERRLHDDLARDLPESPSVQAFGAMLAALEAGCSVAAQYSHPVESAYQAGWNACRKAFREAVGVIEEEPKGFSQDGIAVLTALVEHHLGD